MSSFNYINVDWSTGRVSSTHLRIHELVRSTLISAVGRKELSWMSLLTASTSIGQVVDPLQLMWYTCRFAEGVRKIRVAERTFLDVVVNCIIVDWPGVGISPAHSDDIVAHPLLERQCSDVILNCTSVDGLSE